MFGFGQIARSLELRRDRATVIDDGGVGSQPRRWPRWLRLTGALTALALAIGATAISAAVNRAAPGEPGPFYTAPSPLPDGPPGTIIRTEVIDGFHPDATTYRVLYTSTDSTGSRRR